MKRAFNSKLDLTDVRAMAFLDGLFNCTQRVTRKGTIHVPASHERMSDDTFEVHGYQLPDAAPPPNPPPGISKPEPLSCMRRQAQPTRQDLAYVDPNQRRARRKFDSDGYRDAHSLSAFFAFSLNGGWLSVRTHSAPEARTGIHVSFTRQITDDMSTKLPGPLPDHADPLDSGIPMVTGGAAVLAIAWLKHQTCNEPRSASKSRRGTRTVLSDMANSGLST